MTDSPPSAPPLAGLLFHAGLRRSEEAELTWGNIEQAPNTPGALLIHIRSSKTDQTSERADIRLIKNGAAGAVCAIRPTDPSPSDSVIGLSTDSIARCFDYGNNARRRLVNRPHGGALFEGCDRRKRGGCSILFRKKRAT